MKPMSLPSRFWVVVIFLAAAAVLLAWLWCDPDPVFRPADVPRSDNTPAVANANINSSDVEEAQRELAARAHPEPDGVDADVERSVLRVRLRGIVPQAPWTEPFRIDLDGRDPATNQWANFKDRVEVADDGTASVELPAWVASAVRQKGRIDADDPNYRPLSCRFNGAIDTSEELVLDVQAIAVLEGRVVTMRGEGVTAARVTAFALENGQPVGPEVGTTSTSIEGTYHIEVAAGVPLFLVVTPMKPVQISGMRLTGKHGAIADLGIVRADLLPASREVNGILGAKTSVPDIVVADAARITGVVQWPDGRPIEKAKIATQTVSTAPRDMFRDSKALEVSANVGVRRSVDGTLSMNAATWTNERGEFELPATAGLPLHLIVIEIPDVLFYADVRVITDPGPARVVVEIPAPIRLRPLSAGQTVPQAVVEILNFKQRCDEHGNVDLVTTESVRARARHGRFRSRWIQLSPAHGGTTVDLPLTDALTEIAIEFSGDYRVRNATFRWRDEDNQDSLESLQRGDNSGPFVLFLPPGRYRLRVGPAPGERNGLYLLPVERQVDVGTSNLRLDLPATFGGRFTVHVTDNSGRHVGGTCHVRDAAGDEVLGMFHVESSGWAAVAADGQLLPDGPNTFGKILPPGDYELEFGFEHRGTVRRRVTILPRQVVDVRVRLR